VPAPALLLMLLGLRSWTLPFCKSHFNARQNSSDMCVSGSEVAVRDLLLLRWQRH